MKNILNKAFVVLLLLSFINSNASAEVPYFLDFKFILNQSDAGKKAQTFLKNKLEKGINDLKSKEKKLQEEEKKIISQKKVISEEEYRKKVSQLRKKVADLQKQRSSLLETVANKDKKPETNQKLKPNYSGLYE